MYGQKTGIIVGFEYNAAAGVDTSPATANGHFSRFVQIKNIGANPVRFTLDGTSPAASGYNLAAGETIKIDHGGAFAMNLRYISALGTTLATMFEIVSI